MKGDFTRFTHDPGRRFRGVLMQQGRVQLDADWNEHVAIRDRLERVTNTDVIGPSGAPETGGGFAIGVDGGGTDLTISAGRLYVHGILCELDADGQYTTQPHWPAPEPLTDGDASVDGRTDLVYVDVFQRHVSAVEMPEILDPALDGLDTTTRVQTVWQVRVLKDVGDVSDCANVTTFPPAPSAAQLTSDAVEAPSEEDPCEVVVAGGYRGVENRLYRVEVHDGGALGAATWKWSRDNGAVAFPIEEFVAAPANQLRLARLGRDRVLTLRKDDWIEIVDDAAELGFTPGFTAQVDDVNEATRIVTLDGDVPAGVFDIAANARLRRWDQTQDVNPDGVLETATGPLDLEDGVQVSFGGSDFRTGDYWTFAARVADGDIDRLAGAPPHGVEHHHAALALIRWSGAGNGTFTAGVIADCRETFPPLTDICADDICFDNSHCQLPAAETVQDALDQLCEGRDLRFHNKHLHGWGVVCGLQTVCGPDSPGAGRRQVTVRSGYAIDCEGNDLIVEQDITIDLLDRIQALDQLDPSNPILVDGDGDVCLILTQNGTPTVEVERFTSPSESFLSQLLDGTLLGDVIEDCVRNVLDFLRDQFRTEDEDEAVRVTPGRRRLAAGLNLAIQIVNARDGRFVWLSAEEHRLLIEFYDALRALLSSQTFCAMFDNARPVPEYPFGAGALTTAFGRALHTRLRLGPRSSLAYAVGDEDRIDVFDLDTGEMTASLTFPGGVGVAVQDIAFSADGRQLFVVATLGADTLLAVADIAGGEHRFRPISVMRDVQLVTLGTAPALSNDLFAIGRGDGLFVFNPDNPPSSPRPREAFNATGQLVLAETLDRGFATSRSEGRPDRYDTITSFGLRGGGAVSVPIIDVAGANRTGTDDIEVALTGNVAKLYVTVDPFTSSGPKQVLAYDVRRGAATTAAPVGTTNIENTGIRLRHAGGSFIAAALEDTYQLNLIDIATDEVVTAPESVEPFRIPVQIGPAALVLHRGGEQLAVLNSASRTITRVPLGFVDPSNPIDVEALAAYRDAMVAAFTDLAGGFLQYLKDCFCDHLLLDCPTCDDDDRVTLGCVSVRDNQVYRVCNFTRRRHVITFPKLGYWLSLVPVIPLLKLAVERFCCAVLPDLFGRFTPGPVAGARNRVAAQPIRRASVGLRRFDAAEIVRGVTSRLGFGRDLTVDWLNSERAEPIARVSRLPQSDIVGQPVATATSRLDAAGAAVAEVRRYDPSVGLDNVLRFTRAPTRIDPGTRLVLYEDDAGIVRGYERVSAAAPAAGVPSEDVLALRTEVTRLREGIAAFEVTRAELATTRAELASAREEIARVETGSAAALTARDAEIAALRATTDEHLRALDRIRVDLDTLRRPPR